MSKPFNVEVVQAHAAYLAKCMTGAVYRHYKGGLYRVLAISVHEETGDYLVVYQSEEKGYVWARPIGVWEAYVNPTRENPDGVPRFAIVPSLSSKESKVGTCRFCGKDSFTKPCQGAGDGLHAMVPR